MRQSCKPHPFSACAGLSLHRSSTTKRLPTLELTAQIRKDFQSFPIQLSDTSLRQPHHVPSLSYDNPRGLVRFASGSRLLDPGDSRRQEVQGEIGFIEKFTSERRRDSAPPWEPRFRHITQRISPRARSWRTQFGTCGACPRSATTASKLSHPRGDANPRGRNGPLGFFFFLPHSPPAESW